MPRTVQPLSTPVIHKIREARLSAGLSTLALAEATGITRQFLHQLEKGRALPNVAVALRLARHLGVTVEELFGEGAASRPMNVEVRFAAEEPSVGTRLRLGRVGSAWSAFPSAVAPLTTFGYGPSDGVYLGGGQAELQGELGVVKQNLLIAGCDPALAFLASAKTASEGAIHWIEAGSGRALAWLEAGLVHVAGVHFAGPEGSKNRERLQESGFLRDCQLVRFTRWEQGWIFRRDARRPFKAPEDLAGGRLRLANREEHSAARAWVEEVLLGAGVPLEAVKGYSEKGYTAPVGAARVLAGEADVTIGPRALADNLGLGFSPGVWVDFDLVVPKAIAVSRAWRRTSMRLRDETLRREWCLLPGYEAVESGACVAGVSRRPKSRKAP